MTQMGHGLDGSVAKAYGPIRIILALIAAVIFALIYAVVYFTDSSNLAGRISA